MSNQAITLICPKCNAEVSGVLRTTTLDTFNRRRRECSSCGHRFNTAERIGSDEISTDDSLVLLGHQKLQNIWKFRIINIG